MRAFNAARFVSLCENSVNLCQLADSGPGRERFLRLLPEGKQLGSGLKNITIYSTKDGYAFDNTINSKVLCFAFGLVAEIERNLISMRTKEALALRKAEGVILGRKKGSITKLKILVDNELEIIDRLKKGESMASICRIYGVSTDTFSKFRKVCPSVEEAFQYKMTHFYASSK